MRAGLLCDNIISMPITIDTAGIHPTTVSCLEALEWLQTVYNMQNILDIGCGNGILSLAAAGIWKAKVVATDIAEQAVSDTKANAHQHALDTLVTAIRSDGFQHALIGARIPYDLIICNLLAEPITQMAPLMKKHLGAGGICLISGILAWMADDVERTYLQQGFTMLKKIQRTQWNTFLLKNAG